MNTKQSIVDMIDKEGGTYHLESRDVFLLSPPFAISQRATICCVTQNGSEIGLCNGQGLRKVEFYTIAEAAKHIPKIRPQLEEIRMAFA